MCACVPRKIEKLGGHVAAHAYGALALEWVEMPRLKMAFRVKAGCEAGGEG